MYIKDIVGLIKDPKISIEIKEKLSGASFGIFNNNYIPANFLEKQVLEINIQYICGNRLLIIKF